MRATAHLVYKVLTMVVTQLLCPNDAMEVGFHELLDEIDLSEVFEGRRSENVQDRNDVLMAKVAE